MSTANSDTYLKEVCAILYFDICQVDSQEIDDLHDEMFKAKLVTTPPTEVPNKTDMVTLVTEYLRRYGDFKIIAVPYVPTH